MKEEFVMQNIEEIYEEYSNTLYKYLFCLTHDEEVAEDLTQDVFAIAMDKIDTFKGQCKLSVWLCQIGKHLWYKQLKKDKKYKKISINEINENEIISENIEEAILIQEEKLKLYKDIQKLKEPYRDVIYLKLSGNLNFIEIADIIKKTPNWVRVTYFRAKQKLKD